MPETVLDIVWRNLEEGLRGLCEHPIGGDNASGVVGYALLDLGSGKRAGFRENVVFPTASTIKIAILLAVANKVDSGKLSWDLQIVVPEGRKAGGSGVLSLFKHEARLSLRDLSALIIAVSDNDATNMCIDLVGMDYVNSVLIGLGLQSTRLRRKMMDFEAAQRGEENVSTPGELVRLLEAIYRKDGVNERVSRDVLELLGLPKDGPFSRALPAGVKRENKPGGLSHVSVDAGIVHLPKRDFCLAVMGSFLDGSPEEQVTRVVAAAYRYIALLSECTDLGRS